MARPRGQETARLTMRLELIESLTLPGDATKPNEDAYAFSPVAAAVFDGATGLGEQLMPGKSDAQWLAQFGARRFRAHAEAGEGNIRDFVRGAAADAEKSYAALRRRPPAQNYEIAYASAVFATPQDDGLHLMWFGDCAALLRTPDGTFTFLGDTMTKRESERARVERLVKPGGRGPAAAGVRDEFLPALRAARNHVNTGEDWLFAPDAACADHANETRISTPSAARVLLASDGFLALASDYARYTPQTLFAAAETRGLAALGEELRAIEAADPEGVRFPRFKRSDDATALFLVLAA
ncbi:MAG TPA: protein phosphatase 2C domain-containing protein [Micropepsaceae bacterium]